MRSNNFNDSQRVIVLAPTSRDSSITAEILHKESITTYICNNLEQACKEIEKGADAALLTEEAILGDKNQLLEKTLSKQPQWSDFPLIVLTARETSATNSALNSIGNMTLISRPVHITTLITALRTSLRDRKRQYKLRDYLIERHENESALKQARDHLQLMVESAADFAIISIDKANKIISWNNGATNIFGYEAQEVIGQTAAIIFTEEDRQAGAVEKELQTALQAGRAADERWHLRKDGSRLYLSGIMAAMYDDDKNLKGFLKIARDMTQNKQAEEELIAARNQAQAANIAKTEFLANMSHEIRTPMNAVIGLSNILAVSNPLTQRQQECIQTLRTSADSLMVLINDLLDIAKIEAQSVEIEQVPFSVTKIVEEVISMMSARSKEKGLTFTSSEGNINCKKPFIGDPTRIRQILVNLCSNALKFTEKGGVSISIDCLDTKIKNEKQFVLIVKDTGIGIDPEKLQTIFQKFVQADSSINRKYGGTGLGLAITKTLIEIMGGQIKVTSEPGKGSIFTVKLPLKLAEDKDLQDAAQDLEHIHDSSIKLNSAKKILLVEDHAPNILVAKLFLEEFGYSSDSATNGLEAIEKVKNGNYAAVLMDVQMPGMNGFEATKQIREYEKACNKYHVPIIGMTAHALVGDRERCIAAGMDDYISKPFNPVILKNLLEVATAETSLTNK